jgi:SAM-dependent methyltransferase
VSDETQRTVAAYDKMAAEWIANHDEPDFWLPELERFHRLVPSGHIVEIGPGHGREAAWFIDKGYTYTGVEPSIEMLLYAQDNNRAGNFVHTTVAGFHAESKTFDGFWAAASLLHIPKRRHRGCGPQALPRQPRTWFHRPEGRPRRC